MAKVIRSTRQPGMKKAETVNYGTGCFGLIMMIGLASLAVRRKPR